MRKLHVTIIIVTFNQIQYTQKCFEAILKTCADWYTASYEVLFVDNGSTDGTRDWLKHINKTMGVKVLYNDENLGYCVGANRGLTWAKDFSDYVVMLNNDTLPRQGWLFKMLQTAESEGAAVVGAKILKPGTDLVIHSGTVRDEESVKDPYHICPSRLTPTKINEERLWPNGCCMMISSEVLRKEGVFNEEFKYYFEEADFCMRLRQKGYKISYCPSAEIEHFEKVTASTIPEMHDRFYRSWELLSAKWKNYLDTVRVKPLPRVGIVIPCYNAEKYLRRTLLSIIHQTYPNWRIYLVDDASTDSSLKIAEEAKRYVDDMFKQTIRSLPNYFKDRFQVIPHPINSGVSTARNIARREIIKDYKSIDLVAYCDADDVWHPAHLERSVLEFIKYPATDFVYSDTVAMFEDGSSASSFGIPYHIELDKEKLKTENPIYTSTVVHKIGCFDVGEFDSRLDSIEDWFYWNRIAARGFIMKHIPETFTTYLVRKSGNVAAMANDEKRRIFREELPKLFWHSQVLEA